MPAGASQRIAGVSSRDATLPGIISDGSADRISRTFLVLTGIVWAAPAIVTLSRRYWLTAQGAQGPIILILGGWAAAHLYRRHRDLAQPGHPAIALGALGLAVALAIVGGSIAFASLQVFAALLGGLALLYGLAGARLLRRLWAPALLLSAVIPLPYTIEQALTAQLKLGIARWSVDIMARLGLDVASSGNALFVDQYELMIDAACSGLNSIFSLTLVGLFYIYWRYRGDWCRSLVLAALVVPLAIGCNVLRVCLILLMVHRFGDRPLESVLHPFVGVLMFVVSLGGLVLLDRVVPNFRRQPNEPAA